MKDQFRKEIQAAMKNKDAFRTGTLRMVLAEITTKEKEHGTEATEEDVHKVLFTMVRKRKDAAEQFQKADRADLAEKEKAEIHIIKEFLPQQLSDEEIRKEVLQVIAEVGAQDMKAMGKVMGILTKKLAGKAQGGVINKVVKEELAKKVGPGPLSRV